MTPPIPQREPMLALPEPIPFTDEEIEELNAIFNSTVKHKEPIVLPEHKVGAWAKQIDYKKQYF